MIVRQKRYPKGIKNEAEIRLAWLIDFSGVVFDFGLVLRAQIDQKSNKNRFGKQCKKRSNQNGQGSANERLLRFARPALQAQG